MFFGEKKGDFFLTLLYNAATYRYCRPLATQRL
jgi:hypothetical protein